MHSFSVMWGALSDIIGRKPVLVTNLVLMAITAAIFGFSVNYPMAIIIQLLHGMGNGKL